jgi:hypothetical protein
MSPIDSNRPRCGRLAGQQPAGHDQRPGQADLPRLALQFGRIELARQREAKTDYAYSSGLSTDRPESPWLPPVGLLALPSIAVASPNAPCSIAGCGRTSPPGSNSPATVEQTPSVRQGVLSVPRRLRY